MPRLIPLLLVGLTIVVVQVLRADVPRPEAQENAPANVAGAAVPVGKWKIEFANRVTEQCDIFEFDGEVHATVEEPQRRSRGKVVVTGASIVFTYNDDRVERWTAVGPRFVVEHWFPGSRLPTATPVLGIAERTATQSAE